MNNEPESAVDDEPELQQRTEAVLCPCLIWATGLPVLRAAEAPEETTFDRGNLLRATARLGLPLYFVVLPDQPLYGVEPAAAQQIQQSKTDGAIIDTPYNFVLHHISTKTTHPPILIAHGPLPGGYGAITGESIPHLSSTSDNLTPNILLIRADGKDFLEEHVDALWRYVDQQLKENSVSIASSLTPESFIRFWESLANGKECPVKRGCKACGKESVGQLFCGKCVIVKYCNRECQRSDWAMHKTVCTRKYAP